MGAVRLAEYGADGTRRPPPRGAVPVSCGRAPEDQAARGAAVNYWTESLGAAPPMRPALDASAEVDVAIVGAGYSGLWTAYYLRALRPDWRIAVVEAERVGFGASGRNGGWISSVSYGVDPLLADPRRRAEGVALQHALIDTVDEFEHVIRQEGIDCDYEKGGCVGFATDGAQRRRLRAEVQHWKDAGLDGAACRWLEADEVAKRIRPRGVLGGVYRPQCGVVHPAKLVHGLAAAVEAKGVAIHESTRARQITSGRVETEGGTLRAGVVVRATEAYTSALPGHRRSVLPMHSWIFATEPLGDEQWGAIGLDGREAFGDGRRMVTYGQKTADGRLLFGARGTYAYGSKIHDRLPASDPHYRWMRELLVAWFPALADVEITHHWGGAFAVPRNWRPSICFDERSGTGWLGGYVGMGVGTSNLAARTLAEIITHEETERTRLAWVGAPPPRWEPEPLRWLGVAAVGRAGHHADTVEAAGGSSPIASRLFDVFAGH